MSSRTSSRSTFTTVPSTMSPSLKYLIVSSMAARNASSDPTSFTATCGVVGGGAIAGEMASVLLVMWDGTPVLTDGRLVLAQGPVSPCRGTRCLGRAQHRGIDMSSASLLRPKSRKPTALPTQYGDRRTMVNRSGDALGEHSTSFAYQNSLPETTAVV